MADSKQVQMLVGTDQEGCQCIAHLCHAVHKCALCSSQNQVMIIAGLAKLTPAMKKPLLSTIAEGQCNSADGVDFIRKEKQQEHPRAAMGQHKTMHTQRYAVQYSIACQTHVHLSKSEELSYFTENLFCNDKQVEQEPKA